VERRELGGSLRAVRMLEGRGAGGAALWWGGAKSSAFMPITCRTWKFEQGYDVFRRSSRFDAVVTMLQRSVAI